jgi:hypothetical protein
VRAGRVLAVLVVQHRGHEGVDRWPDMIDHTK